MFQSINNLITRIRAAGPGTGRAAVFSALMLAALIFLPYGAETQEGRYPLGQYAAFEPTGDIRRFAGETLHFDISFLIFKNAATAQVSFEEEKGNYHAILKGKTKGFVGFVTAYREHTYKAIFEVLDEGRRVRAKEFIRTVVEGGKVEKSNHILDYKNRVHRWFEYVNEDLVETGKEEIPEGVHFDDVLSAFYNFRNGVYGDIKPGEKFKVHTIPEKGSDHISIHVQDEAEREKARVLENRPANDEILLDIIAPKEVFHTESGVIRLWASKHYIPLESTVKDYIFLGDLHAILRDREYHRPIETKEVSTSSILKRSNLE